MVNERSQVTEVSRAQALAFVTAEDATTLVAGKPVSGSGKRARTVVSSQN